MAGSRPLQPIFTENFSANLDEIEVFLGGEGNRAFERLLDRLFEDMVPMICRFPLSGRSFLRRTVRSSKAAALEEDVRALVASGNDLRESIVDDYLILYSIRRNQIVFLAIKHHRQLSFDLKSFWRDD